MMERDFVTFQIYDSPSWGPWM